MFKFGLVVAIALPLAAQVPDSATPVNDGPQHATGESERVNPKPNPLEDPRDRIWYPGDTESVKPLARKLFGNILLDQKQIWTSPFHMDKKDAGLWLGFGALTGALIATDRHTSTLLENGKTQVAWANHVSNIGASYTLIPLVAGFYGYGVFRDDPKPREVGVLGAEALLDSLIVQQVLKPIAGRKRPDSQHEASHFFDGGDSFPSGHTIESWALASVIGHEYGRGSKIVPIVAYSLATVVSAARFTSQKHYASDIVAGGAMGWFIGRYVYRTHMDHAIHEHGWLRPQIIPEFDPGTRTYSASLLFVR